MFDRIGWVDLGSASGAASSVGRGVCFKGDEAGGALVRTGAAAPGSAIS